MMTPPAVAVHRLSHCHKAPRLALNDIELAIAPGTFFVLTGPNGSGKSTLFRILCGVLRPSVGVVVINGHDLFLDPMAARSDMGVVFQKPALDKHLSVLENFRIHADMYAIPPALFQQRLDRSLGWSDLRERLHDRVETLSGGLARQTELVKVLLHDPVILILDEPTVGLDPNGRIAFMNTLHRLQQERGITILMTSHIFAEAEKADQVAILHRGGLLALDTPIRLKARLGREILVIQGESMESLAQELALQPGVTLQRQNHELRVQGDDLLQCMTELLTKHRDRMQTIAIKQPTLEDVYIHLTGRALLTDEKENE